MIAGMDPLDVNLVDLCEPVPGAWCDDCLVPSGVVFVYGVVLGDAVLGRPLGVLRMRLCLDCRIIVKE